MVEWSLPSRIGESHEQREYSGGLVRSVRDGIASFSERQTVEVREQLNNNAEMVEWSIAAVLKTVEVRASGGSNPSLCAIQRLKTAQAVRIFLAAIMLIGV